MVRRAYDHIVSEEFGGSPYSQEQTIQLLLDIKSDELFSFCALTYLTAARCCEILPYHARHYVKRVKRDINGKSIKVDGKYEWIKIPNLDNDLPGARKLDVHFEIKNGFDYMKMSIRNEKNRQTKHKTPSTPIYFERDLIPRLKSWLSTKSDDEELFPYCERSMLRRLKKEQPKLFYLHFLRALRATHLFTVYGLEERMVVKYMGLTDGRALKNYLMFVTKDLEEAMIKAVKNNIG